MNYKNIQDCAADLIRKYSKTRSNAEIAAEVREIMQSNTSAISISSYRSMIKKGKLLPKSESTLAEKKSAKVAEAAPVPVIDYSPWVSAAEWKAAEFEKDRTGIYPKQMSTRIGYPAGYDLDSSDRHISVKAVLKSRRNQSAFRLDLTPRETEVLLKDPMYYVYLFKGDPTVQDNLTILDRALLLSVMQLNITARLSIPIAMAQPAQEHSIESEQNSANEIEENSKVAS